MQADEDVEEKVEDALIKVGVEFISMIYLMHCWKVHAICLNSYTIKPEFAVYRIAGCSFCTNTFAVADACTQICFCFHQAPCLCVCGDVASSAITQKHGPAEKVSDGLWFSIKVWSGQGGKDAARARPWLLCPNPETKPQNPQPHLLKDHDTFPVPSNLSPSTTRNPQT